MKKIEASLLFVVITILLDAIGIGIVIPILPDVIRRFGHDPSFVSTYFGYFISLYALMQFLASPLKQKGPPERKAHLKNFFKTENQPNSFRAACPCEFA